MSFFFFNDTATTEIYTLSLHDALPIFHHGARRNPARRHGEEPERHGLWRLHRACPSPNRRALCVGDRKSTRLNSSHANISYAVFCLKKKKKIIRHIDSVRGSTYVARRI